MSYTAELRTRLVKALVSQLGPCMARDILQSDLELVTSPGGFDSDTPIAPESRQVLLQVAELAITLSHMEDRMELREFRSKVRSYRLPSRHNGLADDPRHRPINRTI